MAPDPWDTVTLPTNAAAGGTAVTEPPATNATDPWDRLDVAPAPRPVEAPPLSPTITTPTAPVATPPATVIPDWRQGAAAELALLPSASPHAKDLIAARHRDAAMAAAAPVADPWDTLDAPAPQQPAASPAVDPWDSLGAKLPPTAPTFDALGHVTGAVLDAQRRRHADVADFAKQYPDDPENPRLLRQLEPSAYDVYDAQDYPDLPQYKTRQLAAIGGGDPAAAQTYALNLRNGAMGADPAFDVLDLGSGKVAVRRREQQRRMEAKAKAGNYTKTPEQYRPALPDRFVAGTVNSLASIPEHLAADAPYIPVTTDELGRPLPGLTQPSYAEMKATSDRMRQETHDAVAKAGLLTDLPSAKGFAEHLTDLGAGLTASLIELAVARKIVTPQLAAANPALAESMAWEMLNQAHGGVPGVGAAQGTFLHGVAKLPVPAGAGGEATKRAAEGVGFGGLAAAQGGDARDVLSQGLFPTALHAPALARAIGDRVSAPSRARVEADQQAAKEGFGTYAKAFEDSQRASDSIPQPQPGETATPYYRRLKQAFPDGILPDGRKITGKFLTDAIARAGRASEGFDPARAAESLKQRQQESPPAPVEPNQQALANALSDVQRRQQTLAEGPGEVPQPVRTAAELRRMSGAQLEDQAKAWGVPYDSPSLTLPRIEAAQEEWRVRQMAPKQLWDEVRARGLRAGTPEQNVETILTAQRRLPVRAVEGEVGAPPSSSVESASKVQESPIAGNPARPTDREQTQASPPPAEPTHPAPRRAVTPFTRAAVERRLVEAHNTLGGRDEMMGQAHQALEEEGVGLQRAFTFHNRLPGEVRSFIESNPGARRLFRVTDDAAKAGGADAMAKMGDRYWDLAGTKAGARVGAAKAFAKKSGDPALQFWSAVHDNLPPAKERTPQVGVDPANLNVGQEFELNGHQFQVVEDAEGYRLLKDGGTYPETPVDALAGQKIPVDKGTLKQGEEPALPEGDVFSGLPSDEPTARPAPTRDTGVFGQEILRPATGKEQGGLFHEPVEVARPEGANVGASRSAVDPKNTQEMFPAGTLPHWMASEPHAIELSRADGRQIDTGNGRGTIKRVVPPSAAHPNGAVVVAGPKTIDPRGKEVSGQTSTWDFVELRDRLRRGTAKFTDAPGGDDGIRPGETLADGVDDGGRGIPYTTDPRPSELLRMVRDSDYGSLRGLIQGDRVLWWDANHATHHGFAKETFGREPEFKNTLVLYRSRQMEVPPESLDHPAVKALAAAGFKPLTKRLSPATVEHLDTDGDGESANPSDFPAYFEPKEGRGSGKMAGRTIRPIETPELVKLAKELMGAFPDVKNLPRARGIFRGVGRGEIAIDTKTPADPYQLAKTIAHEIGHGFDWLDDLTLTRGNVLARVKGLRPIVAGVGRLKGFLKNTLGDDGPTNKELRQELMDLSAWWRPGDMTSDYRRKGTELYADFVSTLLNSPGDVEARAPKAYKAFLDAMDSKPTVLRSFLDLQDRLAGTPDDLAAQRRSDLREGFSDAETTIRARRGERQESRQSVVAAIRQALYDNAQPITDLTARAVKRDGRTPQNLAAQYALDELGYSNNDVHLLLRRMERDVAEPVTKAGMTLDDVGEYLAMHRIATERAEIANPFGHTELTAKPQMANLRKTLGPEKTAVLEKAVEKFHDAVFETAERAVEAGVYSRERFETQIKPNRGNYAAFAVAEHVDEYVPAGIRQQVGTFKAVANPFTATVLKTASLNRLINLNRAKGEVRDFLRREVPDELGTPQKIDKHHPEPRPGIGKENLVVLEDGTPVAYEADPYVVRMFNRHDIGGLTQLTKVVSTLTYLRHPLFITLSPRFAVFNPQRDFRRTVKNLGALMGGSRGSVGKVLQAYWRAKGPAWRRATGMDDATIDRMLADKALDVPFSRHQVGEADDSSAYQRLLEQHGLAEPSNARRFYLNTLGRLMGAAETMQTFVETLPKVAAYHVLEDANVPARERSYVVRNYAGTPNLRRRGFATDVTNSALMYSNAMAQGLRADLELGTRPRTAGGWWLRTMAMDVMPKVLMKGAKVGLFGAGVAAMMKMIPAHDLANYTVIPLGTTGEGDERKAVYLRLPHDETGRGLSGMVWSLLDAPDGGLWNGIKNTMGQGYAATPSWSPVLSEAYNWTKYATGGNPKDFRDQPIIGRDGFDAGGWYAAKDMLRWQLGQFGVVSETVDGFTRTPSGAKRTAGEAILGNIPGLKELVRVSDRGMAEDQWSKVDLEDQEAARFRLGLPDNVRKLVGERYRLQRLGYENLSESQAVRLAQLQRFYSGYLDTTAKMKAAQDRKDAATSDRLKKELEVSAKTSEALPPADQRGALKDEARDRILKGELTRDVQDRTLGKLGMQAPADLAITRELHDLTKQMDAHMDARKRYSELSRSASAAQAKGDAASAESLKAQARELLPMAKRPVDLERRLELLRRAEERIRAIRQRIKEGGIDKDAGEDLIRKWVRATQQRAASTQPAAA